MKLLVANRGEIAIRIMRAAAELNIPTVAVFPNDDAVSLHTGKADEAVALEGVGSAAYLDIEQIIGVTKKTGCDAVHPGCGFLAENPEFARRCVEEGLTFIGPSVTPPTPPVTAPSASPMASSRNAASPTVAAA